MLAILLIIILIWRPAGIVGGREFGLPWFKKQRASRLRLAEEPHGRAKRDPDQGGLTMACELTRDKAFFAFSPDVEPAMRVAAGRGVRARRRTTASAASSRRRPTRSRRSTGASPTRPPGPSTSRAPSPATCCASTCSRSRRPVLRSWSPCPMSARMGDMITEMETTILEHTGDTVVFKDKVDGASRSRCSA